MNCLACGGKDRQHALFWNSLWPVRFVCRSFSVWVRHGLLQAVHCRLSTCTPRPARSANVQAAALFEQSLLATYRFCRFLELGVSCNFPVFLSFLHALEACVTLLADQRQSGHHNCNALKFTGLRHRKCLLTTVRTLRSFTGCGPSYSVYSAWAQRCMFDRNLPSASLTKFVLHRR